MLAQFCIYGAFGWCAEIVWTALYEFVTGLRSDPCVPDAFVPVPPAERWRLTGHTYLWMFPIYGAGGLVFGPLHDSLRDLDWWQRGILWTVFIFTLEYISGWVLRRVTGRCPWDYSYARRHLHGLIRFDYTPLWFALGLVFERLHDALRVLG
jgi:uncharacterized membrane protein